MRKGCVRMTQGRARLNCDDTINGLLSSCATTNDSGRRVTVPALREEVQGKRGRTCARGGRSQTMPKEGRKRTARGPNCKPTKQNVLTKLRPPLSPWN